jgi:hypothetical protein
MAVGKGFRPEKASLVCEDDLIGGKTGRIFEAGLDVLRPELRIGSKDDLVRLTGSKLFENQIDGNPGTFETGFSHHHVRPSLNEFRKLHPSTITENSLKDRLLALLKRAQADLRGPILESDSEVYRFSLDSHCPRS